jgi:MFS family permease
MELSFGQRISGRTADGVELHAAVVDENQVRAAAGVTMVMGAVAFSLAYFNHQYALLQVVATLFFVEFLIRLTAGLSVSPIGVIARAMTLRQAPDWVSEKPKRFAWTLGLGMTFAMTIITNSGIRGMLPRTICAICLTLMWMESVLGLCLGCQIHALLVRRGWATKDPAFEICAHGECNLA